MEDHIRRLHERIQALQSAAVELKALEQEHYDDHQQAEREIDRLHKLIADSKKSIDALQEAGSKRIAVVCGGAVRRAERHVSAADLHRVREGRAGAAAGRRAYYGR